MSNQGWKFWVVPLTLWCLYSCWYFGYQSGYADGHETAWNMSKQGPYVFPQFARNDEATETKGP